MTLQEAIAATPPQPTARAFDEAVARCVGMAFGTVANYRSRHRIAAKVEPDLRCRWCRSLMERDYALRCCSRLCRGCSADAGREASRPLRPVKPLTPAQT
jgi:hypothetical protein